MAKITPLTVRSLTCVSSCAFSSVRAFSAALGSAAFSSSEAEPGVFCWAAVHSSRGVALWTQNAQLSVNMYVVDVQGRINNRFRGQQITQKYSGYDACTISSMFHAVSSAFVDRKQSSILTEVQIGINLVMNATYKSIITLSF